MRGRIAVWTMVLLLGAAGHSAAQIVAGTYNDPIVGSASVIPGQGVFGQEFIAPANAVGIQLFSIFVDGFWGFDASQSPLPPATRLPPNGAGTSLRIFAYDPNSFYHCLDPSDCVIQLVYSGSTFVQYTNQPQWLTFANLNVPVVAGGHYLTALDAEYNPTDPNMFSFLQVPIVNDPNAGSGFVDGVINEVGAPYAYRIQYSTVTPEPGTWVLLLSGLVGLAMVGRRKRWRLRA